MTLSGARNTESSRQPLRAAHARPGCAVLLIRAVLDLVYVIPMRGAAAAYAQLSRILP